MSTTTATSKPFVLPVDPDRIPSELKASAQWVGWRWNQTGKGKWTKPPFSVATGTKCDKTAPASWCDFETALMAHQAGRFDGIGFCFTPDDPFAGIDLDDCRNPETGELTAAAQHLRLWVGSYAEVSPSRRGIKIFVRAKLMHNKADHQRGYEIYDRGSYFCVTGNKLPDAPAEARDIQWMLSDLMALMFGEAQERKSPDFADADPRELALDALSGLAVRRAANYDVWLHVGMALHSVNSGAEMLDAWDRWSQCCAEKYQPGVCAQKWQTFKGGGLGIGSLIRWAREDGWKAPRERNGHAKDEGSGGKAEGQGAEEKPTKKALVKLLADAICADNPFTQDAGGRLYRYSGGVYRQRGEEFVKGRVKHLCLDWKASNFWSSGLASEVVEFIRVDSPQLWERPPEHLVNVENGLLRVEDGVLLPHTPKHLSSVQLPVTYDPTATCPSIESFVATTFPHDAHDLAWEIPGVLMTPATWLQKAVLLSGEGCNGKSTWLSLLAAFLGHRNVASMPLHKLESDRFAVSRLLGKLANVCADLPSEHLSGTSMFKAITGGDVLMGEHKFRDSFDFTPFARLIFSANHLPRSADSSSAFFRRWIVIPFDRTFASEDQIPRDVLDARLQAPAELSGLLNQALEGLRHVQEQRGFTEPASVQAAWKDFQATTDPPAVWLERYTIDDPDAFCPGKMLRIAYNAAAEREGRPTLTETAFGRALRKHRPTLEYKQRTVGGRLQWCYIGIGLTAEDSQGSQGSQGFPTYTYRARREVGRE